MWEPPVVVPSSSDLIESLRSKVAGLKEPKQWLSSLVSRHAHAAAADLEHQRTNCLLVGPTGGGKTWLVRSLLESSGLPFIEVNATQFSEVGYIGADLSSMFYGFIEKYADHPREIKPLIAEVERWGVVVLDEFDKWRVLPHVKQDRQPQRAIQAEMLKIAEGDWVTARKRETEQGWIFRTHRMLFIAMGAFEGLGRQIGDEPEKDHMLTEPADLIIYGFMPELVGRFSTIIPLPKLEVSMLVDVFHQSFLPRYQAEANACGFHLEVDEGAIIEMSGKVIEQRVGARGFSALIEKPLYKAWSQAEQGDIIHFGVRAALGGEAELEKVA